ncbi:MAG: antitoxin VbhA family protein [Terracidiphilus sp.]|jgi:hypothetical protein
MAVARIPVLPPHAIELSERRRAVENAVASLRMEALELDEVSNRILDRYASGEFSLDEMSRLIHAHTAAIV